MTAQRAAVTAGRCVHPGYTLRARSNIFVVDASVRSHHRPAAVSAGAHVVPRPEV